MPTDHRAALANIKRFDQLIAYLRDELAWPIEGDDFDEMTFEYTPNELGIDVSNTAKIQEIKRLRPLAPNQPWGHLLLSSSSPSNFLSWHCAASWVGWWSRNALRPTFPSDKRGRRKTSSSSPITVRETHAKSASHTLRRPPMAAICPRSKCLAGTTAIRRYISTPSPRNWPNTWRGRTMRTKPNAWREQWRAAFTLRHREVITTSRELSVRLAELARTIRDRIQTAIAIETQRGPLNKLMEAFQTALIHDLDEDGFADMYAQTIAYGLLSARIADPHKKTADDFASHMRTNPFLRDLMEKFLRLGGRHTEPGAAGIDFDELGVAEVVELLDNAKMDAVVRDFGDETREKTRLSTSTSCS